MTQSNDKELAEAEFPEILKKFREQGFQMWLYLNEKWSYKFHPEYYKEIVAARIKQAGADDGH